MCGIMGYFDKTGARDAELGATMLKMLNALGRRGPDSAGIALYADHPDGTHLIRVKLGDHGNFEERAAPCPLTFRPLAICRDQKPPTP